MDETRLDDLTPDPKNARKHGQENIDLITAALAEVGAGRSILVDETGRILAGNATVEAAKAAGLNVRVVDTDRTTLIAVRRSDLTEAEKVRAALFDNRAAEKAEWDKDVLASLQESGIDLSTLWSVGELSELLGIANTSQGLTDPDETPAARSTDIQPGDLFELGAHRIMCGDTTDVANVRRLIESLRPDAAAITVLHADPPYGMGKEADGVANDNLYDEKLDAFQMQWWRTWSTFTKDNGSAYVWGNAPDLFRLWWRGGLCDEPSLHLRNEIVWDKSSAFGMASELAHSFPPATERCLFLMRGQQFLGNQNKDDYWEGYEPLRAWLVEQRDRAGFTNANVNAFTETNMAGHWFGKSQFQPISKKHYETLQRAAAGAAFTEAYDDLLQRIFGGLKDGGNAHRRELSEQLRSTRTYFDNTHEAMTDVWNFPRVVGAARFGHATPKPVAMVTRALKSSSDVGDVVGVPFCGTGPEFIAGEQLGRRCVGLELKPEYVQIVVDRWEAFTGQKARKVA